MSKTIRPHFRREGEEDYKGGAQKIPDAKQFPKLHKDRLENNNVKRYKSSSIDTFGKLLRNNNLGLTDSGTSDTKKAYKRGGQVCPQGNLQLRRAGIHGGGLQPRGGRLGVNEREWI